jgi:hypothetical protein
LLGNDVPQSRIEALIKEADNDGDGMISFEEFLIMFRNDNCKQCAKLAIPETSGGIAVDAAC